jgi:hypothetical protein
MSKIILSRKGYDDENGGKPSIILPDDKMMFSFPIPVRHKEENGDISSSIYCKDKKLSDIFLELGHGSDKVERCHHVDPAIQKIGVPKSYGAFGQLGASSSHLKEKSVGKGDTFLFFGTFCETYYENCTENCTLKYQMMHPFHALWGYLTVDIVIENMETIPNEKYPDLVNHPHYKNRKHPAYENNNTIYVGQKFGTFKFSEILRLTKLGYKKSYWSLPIEFLNVGISCHEKNKKIGPSVINDRVEFKSVARGQEFIIDDDSNLKKWLEKVLECTS